MAITRANVESILVKRLSGFLTEAGLATTVAGSNADLNDPVGYAVRRLGYTVANVTSVADSDLLGVAADEYDALFDIAELRALETIAQQLRKVDTRVGPLAQSYSQLRRDVMEALKEKREQVAMDYSYIGPQLQAGNITLDIIRKDEDDDLLEA